MNIPDNDVILIPLVLRTGIVLRWRFGSQSIFDRGRRTDEEPAYRRGGKSVREILSHAVPFAAVTLLWACGGETAGPAPDDPCPPETIFDFQCNAFSEPITFREGESIRAPTGGYFTFEGLDRSFDEPLFRTVNAGCADARRHQIHNTPSFPLRFRSPGASFTFTSLSVGGQSITAEVMVTSSVLSLLQGASAPVPDFASDDLRAEVLAIAAGDARTAQIRVSAGSVTEVLEVHEGCAVPFELDGGRIAAVSALSLPGGGAGAKVELGWTVCHEGGPNEPAFEHVTHCRRE